MRRVALLLLCASFLLAPAPVVLAQTSPFGPLPPANPETTPTPTPDNSTSVLGQDVGRATLYAIAGGFVIVFVAIGMFISRDARRTLPPDKRDTSGPERLTPAERRKREQNRKRARQKTRAQKAARKAHRKR
jgi:transposase